MYFIWRHLGLQTGQWHCSATLEQIVRSLLLKSREGHPGFQIRPRSTVVNLEEGSYHLQLISSILNLPVFYPHFQKSLKSRFTENWTTKHGEKKTSKQHATDLLLLRIVSRSIAEISLLFGSSSRAFFNTSIASSHL
jgi:hypothetical protein